jgi:hypothetical protein
MGEGWLGGNAAAASKAVTLSFSKSKKMTWVGIEQFEAEATEDLNLHNYFPKKLIMIRCLAIAGFLPPRMIFGVHSF